MMAPKTRFAWRSEDDGFEASAQKVGEALEAIRQENEGELFARDIVVVARKSDSPLHPLFEWDDKIAARLQREGRAREIVTAIVVVQPGGTRERYAFVERAEDRGTDAFPRAVVQLRAATPREDVVARAMRALEEWVQRYGKVTELEPAVEQVRGAIDAVSATR